MKEPKRIKLTDSPETKKVQTIPLPPLNNKYLEPKLDTVISTTDIEINIDNENNQQNNS